jgi:putative membrane protein
VVGPSTDPAIVAVLVVEAVLDRCAVLARLEACRFILDDLVSFVILWGAINLYAQN